MQELKTLFDAFEEMGVDFFTGVPDSLLNDFCLYLTDHKTDQQHVMAANEGNAIAVAAGHYMATGKLPLVYMQNSGMGSASNPLLSLTHNTVYGIPMLLLIGWRGDPSASDHAHHKKQGELTPVLLTDMDIPYEILDDEATIIEKFCWAADKAREISSPVALIVKKGVLTKTEKKHQYSESELMSREEAISAVLDIFGGDVIYLATTGRATRELHEQLKLHGIGEGHEWHNVGSMGHVSSVALGIALAHPDKKIVVFDGDAAAIMHMGALATNCRYKAGNLIHIVLNNGVNESVGGQPSAGQVVNLTGVADACGYQNPGKPLVSREDVAVFLRLPSNGMPKFVDFQIRQGIRSGMPMLDIDHKAVKNQVMEYLQK